MSKEHDAMKQVRVIGKHYQKLESLKKKLPIKFPIGTLANLAIERGIPIVEKELSR